MKIYCKVHQQQNKTVVAVCDQTLIGKTLIQGEIEFRVSESFYKGTIVTEKEMIEQLQNADSANLIGKKCVESAINHGFIKKEDTITIDTQLHAIILRI